MSLKQAATDLSGVPDRLLEGALEAILEQAQLMKGYAQIHVRVDTGTLRDTIRVERGGRGKHWAVVYVRAGGYRENPKTGKLVDYAVIVELRFPYMRPAWEAVRTQVADVIRRYCLLQVQDVERAGVLRFT